MKSAYAGKGIMNAEVNALVGDLVMAREQVQHRRALPAHECGRSEQERSGVTQPVIPKRILIEEAIQRSLHYRSELVSFPVSREADRE